VCCSTLQTHCLSSLTAARRSQDRQSQGPPPMSAVWVQGPSVYVHPPSMCCKPVVLAAGAQAAGRCHPPGAQNSFTATHNGTAALSTQIKRSSPHNSCSIERTAMLPHKMLAPACQP
jgi:hypothetical protein